MLSKRILGWVSHDIIHQSPKGYQLDDKDDTFASIPEMIAHYQDHAVGDFGQVLGTGIATVPSGKRSRIDVAKGYTYATVITGSELKESMAYETIKFTKVNTLVAVT